MSTDTLENPMVRAEPREPTVDQQAREDAAIMVWTARVTSEDLADEMAGDSDVKLAVNRALLLGDPAVLGRVLFAVRKTYATRLALRDLYEDPELPECGHAALEAVGGLGCRV